MRRCQQAIREQFPLFNPKDLDQFLQLEKAQTNAQAKKVIDHIESELQRIILDELRREFGPEDSQWWTLGVPKPVRLKVMERYEEEDGKRGGREYYFELMDYRKIALDNWGLFEPILAHGKTGNKEKRTSWMVFVNDKRRIVSHVSSGVTLPLEDLADLEHYQAWLSGRNKGSEIPDEDHAVDS